jgi:hypothetical protein
MEVGMLKKFLWLSTLVLITACTVYISSGGVITGDATPTTTDIAATNAPPTVIVTTAVTPVVTNTPKPTATKIPATPTATATKVPTATATATKVPTATATATSIPMTFGVQPATPVYMVNFAHTAAGCAWQGVAGQVFDSSNNPVTNYVVKITGSYNGSTISMLGVTGMVSGNPYGPGSYEIVLGTKPINSVDLLNIQVFTSSGQALTDPLKFSTSSDCSKNLIIINFIAK